MELGHELLIKLLLCIAMGGVVGAERELRSKSAGFRTLILICIGAALFTMVSLHIGGDAGRIAANVVVGIGFVGAGVVFKGETGVNGITTAATIWVTAALGMLIGAGYYIPATISCTAIIVVLFLLSFVERRLDAFNQIRSYRLAYSFEAYKHGNISALIEQFGLELKTEHYRKVGSAVTGNWVVQGSSKNHKAFIVHMLEEVEVQDFEW